MTRIFVPCLMGPTGAGKTASALALAKIFPISVINADSRQVYADFPLITAQPSPTEQAVCPHLLYGFLPTPKKLGAGEYSRLAAQTITEEVAKGRVPLLVGGTGLYFRTLLDGIASIPSVPSEIAAHWQARCDAEGSRALHPLLEEIDPAYAAKIHPNDKQRIVRALEVWQATGKAFSWWHAQPLPPGPYRACKMGIALTLKELEPLLEKRIHIMLEQGALTEARAALEMCSDPGAAGWSGIGCMEVYQHLTGKLSLDEACALWFRNTRAYAKRQLTWFRADTSIRWFAPSQVDELCKYALACRDESAKENEKERRKGKAVPLAG